MLCSKRFLETYSFLPRYFQRTTCLTGFIASKPHDTTNLSFVTDRASVAPYAIDRILDYISFERPTLGEAISIDEFKGNAIHKNINVSLLTLLNTMY